jgi:hypothetical protein
VVGSTGRLPGKSKDAKEFSPGDQTNGKKGGLVPVSTKKNPSMSEDVRNPLVMALLGTENAPLMDPALGAEVVVVKW